MIHLKQDKQYFPWSAHDRLDSLFQFTVQLYRSQLADWFIAQLNKD